MDAGTKFSMKLTNGKTLEYRIIGINHDDLADGSGMSGLTFEATNSALGCQRMNATDTNAGGWDKSELRTRLNIGDLWSLLPTELQSKVKPVTKTTDNVGGNWGGAPLGDDRQGFSALGNRSIRGYAIRRHPVRVLQIQGRDGVELFRCIRL